MRHTQKETTMSQSQMTLRQAGILWLTTVGLALACAMATPRVSAVHRHALAHAESGDLMVRAWLETAHDDRNWR